VTSHRIALYAGRRVRIRAILEQRREENCHDARISELTNDFSFRNTSNIRERRVPPTLYKHGLSPHVDEVCTSERLFSRF
jgi:hypothetical protein